MAEYVKVMVMHPVCTALDVLQGDKVVGLGYLVPTLTIVKNRLKECSQTLTVCKPMAAALQTAVNTRFSEMMEDLNAPLAAVVNPMFKLDLVDDATAKVTLTQLLKNRIVSDARHEASPSAASVSSAAPLHMQTDISDESTSNFFAEFSARRQRPDASDNDITTEVDRYLADSSSDLQSLHKYTIRYDTRCYFNVRSKADFGRHKSA